MQLRPHLGPTKRRHFKLKIGLLTAKVLQVKNDTLKELQLKPSSAHLEEICKMSGDISFLRYACGLIIINDGTLLNLMI